MTDQFDIIVAGAGHNSLIAAAYLARAGLSCLVLEARPVIGGNTMTEELTLPGFLHDTCSTTHSIFMESPIWRNQELPLAEYGLEYISADPASHVVFSDGSYITQWIDLDRTCEEISKFSRRDADTNDLRMASCGAFLQQSSLHTRRMDIGRRATGFTPSVSDVATSTGTLGMGHHRLLF